MEWVFSDDLELDFVKYVLFKIQVTSFVETLKYT